MIRPASRRHSRIRWSLSMCAALALIGGMFTVGACAQSKDSKSTAAQPEKKPDSKPAKVKPKQPDPPPAT